MILSHKYKFIYIKTYKTASTSMEAALSAICGPDDVITPTSDQLMPAREGRPPQNYRFDHPAVPKRPLWRRLLMRPERYYHPSVGFYEHMPAEQVKTYVGDEVWTGYFKFSFERNPWDRQVSWYKYKTKSKGSRGPTFREFMADRRRAYRPNHDLYMIGGAVAMDLLGRYETVHDDFALAMKEIGIKERIELPVANVSRDANRDYRSYYDDELKALAGEWYAPEIELLGYEF